MSTVNSARYRVLQDCAFVLTLSNGEARKAGQAALAEIDAAWLNNEHVDVCGIAKRLLPFAAWPVLRSHLVALVCGGEPE